MPPFTPSPMRTLDPCTAHLPILSLVLWTYPPHSQYLHPPAHPGRLCAIHGQHPPSLREPQLRQVVFLAEEQQAYPCSNHITQC